MKFLSLLVNLAGDAHLLQRGRESHSPNATADDNPMPTI
jgi:hypothetical protein